MEAYAENDGNPVMDDLAAYAIGALEPDEAKRVEDLLVSSAGARAALEELQEGVIAFALGLPTKEPPPHMRDAVIGRAVIYGGELSVSPSPSTGTMEMPQVKIGWLERLVNLVTPARAVYAGGATVIAGLAALSISLAVINSNVGAEVPEDMSVAGIGTSSQTTQINPAVESAGSAFGSAIEANSEPFLVFLPSVASGISETANTSAVISNIPDEDVEATFRRLPELSEGSKFRIWGINGSERELIEEFFSDEDGTARVKIGRDMAQLREYERIVVTHGGEAINSRGLWFPKSVGR